MMTDDDNELMAVLRGQRAGIYIHGCGSESVQTPLLPGPGVPRWCTACDAVDEAWIRKPEPARRWDLPVEPGLEVKAVKDHVGHLWVREPDGWIYRTGRFNGARELVHRLQWNSVYRYYAPLVDATGEVDDAS